MRLIDADEVIKKINDFEITPTTNLFRLLGGVIGIVNNAPTVDPVKCGKWEKMPQLCRWWICTQCNHIIHRVVLPHYCECCGSKMERDNG